VEQFSFECFPLVQEISSAVHHLHCCGRWLIALFVQREFGAESLVFCPIPLSLGQVQCSICHLPFPSYITVSHLLFSFSGQCGFGCCFLAQEIISVIQYLLCFGLWLVFCLLSALLSFLCLFT
jgi:hypothetical protein